MKTAIVIPARFASVRFPGKPLHVIKGKFLIERVIEQALKCKVADVIVCATDDKKIYNAVKKLGYNVFMTPVNLKSGTDRIAYVAKKHLKGCSVFINVQGDEPLADPMLMSALIKELKKDKSLHYVTAAVEMEKSEDINNPNIVKVVLDKNNNALYFSRSAVPFIRGGGANVPKPKFYKHMGIYGYKRDFLLKFASLKPTMLEQAECLEQLRALEAGNKVKVVISKKDSLGVDTPADARRVSRLIK